MLRADWRACPPDLVLVPGVAFDARCGRLGRGGGYYDCFLAARAAECAARGRAAPFLVGAALEPQALAPPARVPREAWDAPLDCVVFPAGQWGGAGGEGGSEAANS